MTRRALPASILLFLLIACHSGPSVKTVATLSLPIPFAPRSDQQILAESGFPKNQVGYLLFDPEAKHPLRSHQPFETFIPASVTKVATSLFALDTLGPNYRFRTTLTFVGRKENGIWQGNLYLKGGGDPFLMASDLLNFARALHVAGMRQLTGHLYYDESFFPPREQIWADQEVDAVFNTSVSALSAEFNRMQFVWKPGPDPDSVLAFLYPNVNGIQLRLTDALPDHPRLRLGYLPGQWLLPKDLTGSGSLEIPAKNGALYTSSLFRSFCQNFGMALPEPEAGVTPPKAPFVYVHESPPLWELVGKALEFSNNLMSEMLLQSAASVLMKKPQSASSASQIVVRSWKKRYPNTRWDGFSLENGSGLNVKTRFSPDQTLSFLHWAYQKRYNGKTAISLFPMAAWTGTLKTRFHSPDAAMRVWAKTGTVNYASALGGALFARSGKPLLFVVFVNDPERAILPLGSTQNATRDTAWTEKARALQENLVTNWIASF